MNYKFVTTEVATEYLTPGGKSRVLPGKYTLTISGGAGVPTQRQAGVYAEDGTWTPEGGKPEPLLPKVKAELLKLRTVQLVSEPNYLLAYIVIGALLVATRLLDSKSK